MNTLTIMMLMIVPEILLLLFLIWYLRLPLIVKGIEAKLRITPMMLIGMRLRKINPDMIVLNAIKLKKAGINLELDQPEDLIFIFEAHCLAGGNVARVTAALLEAQNRSEPLSLKQACAIDLELVTRKLD